MQNLRLSVRISLLTIIIFLLYTIINIYTKAFTINEDIIAINEDNSRISRNYNEDNQLGNLLSRQNEEQKASSQSFDADEYRKSSDFIWWGCNEPVGIESEPFYLSNSNRPKHLASPPTFPFPTKN